MAQYGSSSIAVARRGIAPTTGDDACAIVWVRGECDITTKVPLAVAIARAARRHEARILVDLSAVTFMDASTVGAIVGCRNRLQLRAKSLEVRAPSTAARRVLELCGLAHLIHPLPVDQCTVHGTTLQAHIGGP